MKLDWFDNSCDYYNAIVELCDGGYSILLYDSYSTKIEAINAIEVFKNTYNDNDKLSCYIEHHTCETY